MRAALVFAALSGALVAWQAPCAFTCLLDGIGGPYAADGSASGSNDAVDRVAPASRAPASPAPSTHGPNAGRATMAPASAPTSAPAPVDGATTPSFVRARVFVDDPSAFRSTGRSIVRSTVATRTADPSRTPDDDAPAHASSAAASDAHHARRTAVEVDPTDLVPR